MSESSFTLLREIGSFPLEKEESVRFSIDAYRGYRYVSVRRYLQTDGFSGATRDGITLTPEIVRVLVPRLQMLTADSPQGAVGKFAKRPGICVVVRVAVLRGKRVVDFRQWENGAYTQKGLWLPLEKLPEIKKLFLDTLAALNESPTEDF